MAFKPTQKKAPPSDKDDKTKESATDSGKKKFSFAKKGDDKSPPSDDKKVPVDKNGKEATPKDDPSTDDADSAIKKSPQDEKNTKAQPKQDEGKPSKEKLTVFDKKDREIENDAIKPGITLTGEKPTKVDIDPEIYGNSKPIEEGFSVVDRARRGAVSARTIGRHASSHRNSKFRHSTVSNLQKRARRMAIKNIRKRILRGRSYNSMPPSERAWVAQRMKRLLPTIAALAKKIYPKVRTAEIKRKLGSGFSHIKVPEYATHPHKRLHEEELLQSVMNVFEQMPQQDNDYELSESEINNLVKKSESSGFSVEILETVFRRGLNEWEGLDEQDLSFQNYAFNRVNSFLSGGLAYDQDIDLAEAKNYDDEHRLGVGHRVKIKDTGKKGTVTQVGVSGGFGAVSDKKGRHVGYFHSSDLKRLRDRLDEKAKAAAKEDDELDDDGNADEEGADKVQESFRAAGNNLSKGAKVQIMYGPHSNKIGSVHDCHKNGAGYYDIHGHDGSSLGMFHHTDLQLHEMYKFKPSAAQRLNARLNKLDPTREKRHAEVQATYKAMMARHAEEDKKKPTSEGTDQPVTLRNQELLKKLKRWSAPHSQDNKKPWQMSRQQIQRDVLDEVEIAGSVPGNHPKYVHNAIHEIRKTLAKHKASARISIEPGSNSQHWPGDVRKTHTVHLELGRHNDNDHLHHDLYNNLRLHPKVGVGSSGSVYPAPKGSIHHDNSYDGHQYRQMKRVRDKHPFYGSKGGDVREEVLAGDKRRVDMPQLTDYDNFKKDIDSAGHSITQVHLKPSELLPFQKHINDEKVDHLIKNNLWNQKPIVISSDHQIVDGHHRWAAAKKLDKNIACKKVSMTGDDLVDFCKGKPYTQTKTLKQ
jgi:hypothetical protein